MPKKIQACQQREIVWGHVTFGQMRYCASMVERGARCSSMVPGVKGKIWPCYSVKSKPKMSVDLVAVTPKKVGYMYDCFGDRAPMFLIGYLKEALVYRTTHTLATYMEGHMPGSFQVHWPALFPHTIVAECEAMQADVTIRTEFSVPLSALHSD